MQPAGTGALPILWGSIVMEETPSIEKSKGGAANPAFFRKGRTKPPKAASTWR
jgi:hypothetical protein